MSLIIGFLNIIFSIILPNNCFHQFKKSSPLSQSQPLCSAFCALAPRLRDREVVVTIDHRYKSLQIISIIYSSDAAAYLLNSEGKANTIQCC